MGQVFHYDTVVEAINNFKKKGYTTDFNLKENCIGCMDNTQYGPNDFKVVEMYRYEGDSDPADEASVYAIELKSGKKGILVTGNRTASDPLSTMMLEKLQLPR